MSGLVQRAEDLAQKRVAQVRDGLADSLAIWLPGVLMLIDASGVRAIGKGVRQRWNRAQISERLREADHER